MDEFNITSAQYVRNKDDTANIVISATINSESLEVPLVWSSRRYLPPDGRPSVVF